MRITEVSRWGCWLLSLMPVTCTLASTPLGSASTLSVTANIVEGSCEVQFNTSTLVFSSVLPIQFASRPTVDVKPVRLTVTCDHPSAPTVKVTGQQPYVNNDRIFLDTTATRPHGNGVGFMVQPAQTERARDTPPDLAQFYLNGMQGSGMQADTDYPLIPLTQTVKNSVAQVLWVGLVRVNPVEAILPGAFSSALTVTVSLP